MIKTIIFDFGNVLYDLDIDGCIDRLATIASLNREALIQQLTPVIERYEQGKVSDENLVWHVQQHNQTINPRLIVEAWNSMLVSIDASVLPMLERLQKVYNLYLLSNINGFHARHVDRYLRNTLNDPEFLTTHFEKVYYSHELRMRKPQPEIYDYVTKDIGKDNNQSLDHILFIDDNKDNIAAANAYGWSTILHNPALRIAEQIDGYISATESASGSQQTHYRS